MSETHIFFEKGGHPCPLHEKDAYYHAKDNNIEFFHQIIFLG